MTRAIPITDAAAGAAASAPDYSEPLLLPTVEREAEAFWRLRRLTLRRAIADVMKTSRLRLSLVVFLSLFFWTGLYVLFAQGFQFLTTAISHPATHAETIHAIYNVFFLSLMVMLIFSSAIILYSGLYATREASYLLSLPARAERIVLHKFQEAVFFSSWGFFLLGSPMLVAHGVEAHAPWYYYVLLVPFMVAFVYIPGSIGSIACLLVVHFLPRLRVGWLAFLGVGCAALIVAMGFYLVAGTESNLLTPLWFQEVLSRLQFSEHRLLPSWWLSSGLLEAVRGEGLYFEAEPWAQSVLFLTLLVSNALMLHLTMVMVARRLYRRSFSELAADRPARRPRRYVWFDRLILGGLPFLPRQMRLLLVKDLRLFRRDPVQWSQFLIFFGLLALYFANIRRFSYDMNYAGWVNLISFLNLAVVGLILSTFTTRFIFPMISLEGRRFWILGLLPISRDSILMGKFIFAVCGSIIPCSLLILLSDLMLEIGPLVVAVHQLTCAILCLGLSGIAVGLGARMPDLREQSPSKIAAGFGGTLNLVLSAGYIVAVVLLTALPCHFYVAAQQVHIQATWLRLWLFGGTAGALLLGMLATILPMRMGLKAFRALEF